MKSSNSTWPFNKNLFEILYFFAFFGMLETTFILPVQALTNPTVSASTRMIECRETRVMTDILPNQSGNTDNTSDKDDTHRSSTGNATDFTSGTAVSHSKYFPDLESGVIGEVNEFGYDNGIDNVFNINIPRLIEPTDKVILEYELFGVKDQSSVARSINGRFSIGGYVIQKAESWSLQTEELKASWLKPGINTIRFGTVKEGSSYKIRNLRINVYHSRASFPQNEIILACAPKYLPGCDLIYLKGYLQNVGRYPVVSVNGEKVFSYDDEFEALIPADKSQKQNVTISAFDESGLLEQRTFRLQNCKAPEQIFPMENFPDYSEFDLNSCSNSVIHTGVISLDIDSLCNSSSRVIGVAKLRKADEPILDPGLVNVTTGGTVYRFSPDGTKFAQSIRIGMGYDSSLIPPGYSPEDIRSFYYNTSSRKWEMVTYDSIDKKDCKVFALTDHFTDYINGIIKVPESPQTSAFVPTMMNDIKAADPASKITLISPPEASQTGEASIEYPIEIPDGRRGMQPSLTMKYNSNGGNSWIGTGWDLNVSSISIDTRWGVPTFGDLNGDGDYQDSGEDIESEIYTLDGQQLMYPQLYVDDTLIDWMPNRHYEPSPNVYSTVRRSRLAPEDAVFTFRKQGSFTKIERLGNSPSTYYWKVTSTDGTINWYGGKTPSDIQDSLAVIKSPSGNIVHWALFMTEDVYGNTVKYKYSNSGFPNSVGIYENLSLGKIFNLSEITYTGSSNSNGNYKVDFIVNDSVRPDVTIYGRNGFKQIDPYLLSQVNVSYKSQLIRDYTFSYKAGAFQKMLLDSITVNDGDNNKFYSYRFDYYNDVIDGFYTTDTIFQICPKTCFTVDFPVPVDSSGTVYLYKVQADKCDTMIGLRCMYPESIAKIYDVWVEGTQFIPNPDNIYMTHYQNNQVQNLCPVTNIFPNTDFQNPNFSDCFEDFIHNVAFQSISPFDVRVANLCEMYRYPEDTSLIAHVFGTTAEFKTFTPISAFLRLFVEGTDTLRTFMWEGYPLTTIVPKATNIKIQTAPNGIHDFGNYYLTDPYYISKLQNDIMAQYPGTEATIQANGGNITIQISQTDIVFIEIILSHDGSISSIDFSSCDDGDESDHSQFLSNNSTSEDQAIDYGSFNGNNQFNILASDDPTDSQGSLLDSINFIKKARNFRSELDPSTNSIVSGINNIKDSLSTISATTREPISIVEDVIQDGINNDKGLQLNSPIQVVDAKSSNFQVEDTTKLPQDGYPNNSMFKYLNENFRVRQTRTVLDSDTGCDPIINTTFHDPYLGPTFSSAASPLGSTQGLSDNVSGYLGVGVGCNPVSKANTFGYQYNHGWNWNKSFVSLVDIDGDGLDDIVSKSGNKLFYKKQVISRQYDNNNEPTVKHYFLPEMQIVGLNTFYSEKGQSSTSNFQLTVGAGNLTGFVGIDFTNSKSETNIYFADANGDGLIDVIKNGVAYFNHLVNGVPTFEADSKNTENMVITASPIDIGTPPEYINDTINYPDVDVVKVWEAPCSGTIKIDNYIELTDRDKEAEVTIEMQSSFDSVPPDPNCFHVEFPSPSIYDTVYYYWYGDGMNTMLNYGYGGYCLYKPYTLKVISMNGFIPTDSLFTIYYEPGNGCYFNPPKTVVCCQEPWVSCLNYEITTPNFVDNLRAFVLNATVPYQLFDLDIVNLSGAYDRCYHIGDSIWHQWADIMAIDMSFKSCINLGNSLPLYTHYTSCIPDTNARDVHITLLPRIIRSTIQNVGINTAITIITSTNSLEYGPYNLSDPDELSLFESDLQAQFAGAVVSTENSFINIQLPDCDSYVISIILSGGGIDNTYLFSECADSTKRAEISGWHNAKPTQQEVEWSNKKSVANGEEIGLPIPDCPVGFTYTIPMLNDSMSNIGIYRVNITKDSIAWFERGRIITNPDSISILNSFIHYDSAYYSNQMQNIKAEILSKRIKARDAAKVELGEYYHKKKETLQRKEPNVLSNTCSYQPKNLCLLFGTILDSTNVIENNSITKKSIWCHPQQDSLRVEKGDRIYFRVHNVENGNPPVFWNPKIEYTSTSPSKMVDQNGLTPFSSQYSDGFILSSNAGVVYPGNGTANITWDTILVDHPSDTVTYEIVKQTQLVSTSNTTSETIVYSKVCPPNQNSVVASAALQPVEVTGYDPSNPSTCTVTIFQFKVFSTSNVDWKRLEWKPKMICTSEETIVKGEDGLPEDTIVVEETKYPIAEYSIYKSFLCSAPYNLYTLPTGLDSTCSICPSVEGLFDSKDNGLLYFVIKSNNTLVGKIGITITNGSLTYSPDSLIRIPDSCRYLEIGYYKDDSQDSIGTVSLLNKIASASGPVAEIKDTSSVLYTIPNYQVNLFQKPNQQYGPMHRQWGQFMYNPAAVEGGVQIGVLPGIYIKEDALELTEEQYSAIYNAGLNLGSYNNLYETNVTDTATLAEFEANFNQFKDENEVLTNLPFITAMPQRNLSESFYIDKWIGFHDQCYAMDSSSCAEGFKQSFSGFTDPEEETVQGVINTGAYGISKYSKSKGKNFSAGFPAGFANASYTKSLDSYSVSLSEYTDINGDDYPDILTANEIQTTTRTGGLYAKTEINDSIQGDLMKSKNDNWGVGASGSFSAGGKENSGSSSSGAYSVIYTSAKSHDTPINAPNGNNSIGISGNYSEGKNSTNRLWTDINGDGLSDLIVQGDSSVYVRLNYGNNTLIEGQQINWGSFEMQKGNSKNVGGGIGFNYQALSIEAGVSLGTNLSSQEYSIIDINGDGLMDIVHTVNDSIRVRLNYGNHFSEEISYSDFNLNNSSSTTSESVNLGLTYCVVIPIPFIGTCLKIALGATGEVGAQTNKTKKVVTDFDGDGFPDLLQQGEIDNSVMVRYSNIRRTNKLKSVINPLGGKFTVDYQVAPKDYNNPNAKWVMSELTVEDGFDAGNDGCDMYRKSFEYVNGKYDRREREFYGFEKVKTIDYIINPDSTKGEPYRTTLNTYYNGNYYLAGKPKKTCVYKGGDESKLFSAQENVYELKSMANNNTEIDINSDLPLTFDVGGREGRRTAAVLLKETTNSLYELGSSPVTSKTGFDYDNKGRVVSFHNYGDINNPDDDYYSMIDYYSNTALTDKNIINVPDSIKVVDANNEILRLRYATDISNSTGAIGTIMTSIDASTSAETNLTYTSQGNLHSVTLPENQNSERMSYTYTYDADDAKYIVQVTNAQGYSSSSQYDPKFDVLKKSFDITNNETDYYYDSFGRLIKVVGPNEIGTGTNPYTILFEYFPTFESIQNSTYSACVNAKDFKPVAITKHFDIQHSNNPIETYTFIDGLARPIQIKKDIQLNTNKNPESTPIYIEAMSISGREVYDDYGRVVEKFHPTWEEKDCAVNIIINKAISDYSSKIAYDEIDRPVHKIDPEGNTTDITYSVSSNKSMTRMVTDQNGTQSVISETYKDATGNTVQISNVGPNGNVVTDFTFDPIGQLLSYTDDDGLTSTYTYDRAGRKLSFTHPDNGLTSYAFDKSGNLISLQTANLAASSSYINYTYDYNQLVRITFPEMNGYSNIANTTYTYGLPGSGNSTGRVNNQTDATGSQAFVYDKMGNVVQNTRTVVAPSTSLPDRTFVTASTYDSWNRIQSLTYPDAEQVVYSYDFGGNLVQITGDLQGTPYNYLDRADYDHFEQRTYIKYGNGTRNLYTYSPSLRWVTNLTVKSPTSEVFENLSYSYDHVGNITGLENTAVFSQVNGMGGSSSNSYSYDVLNRLESGSGSFTGDKITQPPIGNDYEANYSLEMTYSNTGRILNKDQFHAKNGSTNKSNTYTNEYSYISGTHSIYQIQNTQNQLEPVETFFYDANGNITSRGKGSDTTDIFWDESNQLRVLSASNLMHHYLYDASGERIMKARSSSTKIYINGQLVNNTITMNNYITYPSNFMVVDPNGIYSKHYYMGTQRIAIRIGDGSAAIFEDKSGKMPGLKGLQQNDMMYYFSKNGIQSIQFEKYEDPGLNDSINTDNNDDYIKPPSIAIYYYHPDHLGTNTIVTNMNGNVYQYFLNLPFGETMAEQTSSGYFQSPWKFNGKELDAETGLYYYGARYYYSRLSNWLNVDPLAAETPAWSPYVYCNNSPSVMIDPDGRYTKLGAWIRNIWWGGAGISKSGKEWGVQLIGKALNGDDEIVFQTKGSKHWFRDDYISAWKTNYNLARTLDQAGIEYTYTNDVNEARSSQLDLATFLLIPTPLLKGVTIMAGSGVKAVKGGTQLTTRFVSTADGIVDVSPTLNRISSGVKFPHRNDGSIFKNIEGLLPNKPAGYYNEFVHPIPGMKGPGPMRIVTGQGGEMWFNPDHYKTFIPIR